MTLGEKYVFVSFSTTCLSQHNFEWKHYMARGGIRRILNKKYGIFIKTVRGRILYKGEVLSQVRSTENPKSKILRGVFQNFLLKSLRSEEKKSM